MDDVAEIVENVTDETAERDLRMTQETLTRGATVEVSHINAEKRTVQLSFASEKPVERWFGMEILEMTPRAADLNRLNNGGALLSDHNMRQQIGKVEKAWIGDDKRAHAIVRFSERQAAEDEFKDVCAGIRENVSFGYRIKEHRTEKGQGNAPDKITATRWEAFEISLVAIPADEGVGVGRAQEDLGSQEQVVKVKLELDTTEAEQRLAQIAENKRGSKMDNENEVIPANKFSREQEMIEYGKLFGKEDLARQFAADPNKNLEGLRTALAEAFKPAAATPQTMAPGEVASLGLNEKEARQYSITRAILAAADDDWSDAEFERECHDTVAERIGKILPEGKRTKKKGSFFVPTEVQTVRQSQRDLSVVGGGAAGAYLVGTDHMPGSFIEILRNKTKMLQLGVRVMSGLVGNPSIPRQDGAATAYWIAEGVAPTESQQVFAQLGLNPKTVGAKTDFTRQLLIQSAPSVDMIVMDDLAAVMARAIDLAIIDGTGSAGQPTGFLRTTGVDEVNIIATNFAYKDAVHFESLIAEENAPDGTAWLCRPGIKGTLKVIPKIGSTYPVFLCGDDNRMNGYRVETTMQMPADTLAFGDYSQIILGEWGVLELEANRYGTGFAAGNIEVRALHMVDVAVRYPQALKKLTAFVSDQD